jgi:hypothetical protein
MNLNELHDRLIAAAKSTPPGDHVPYAFEKRIMVRLASVAPPNPWALWAPPLWRAAVSCLAITLLCGLWSFAAHPPADSPESFSQAFEAAVVAPPAQHAEDAW